jgi:predicted ATPase/signal transduction histidine kinase
MVKDSMRIPGYYITEKLYNGSRTIVYRGVQEPDQKSVVIKLLKNKYPSFSELVQFRNQYTIAKNLNSPEIIQIYSLEPYQNGYILVMEDFGGSSSKDYFASLDRTSINFIEEFLEFSIIICNALDILYKNFIIHKDIKPSNILINPQNKQVKLIDFSIASLLPRETQSLVNLNVLEGTLAYISPEQTGRMNRGIDYRTDYYSLGVSFFEFLTGKLPFKSEDPMELVHCHIAKKAPLVHEINPHIPPILSEIVSKLMAKNAEDRYQSIWGLKYDLEKCFKQIRETGEIKPFTIAQRDMCDRFMIPDKLYGRESEVETLLQAFERVSQGTTEMMLVAGFSGVGKTAVVNEVHKPIVRQRGYFIKGKFDQFNRNIPFSAFVQAFRDLMGQLLTESDAKIQEWKNKILTVVGENGQVIIEVIPELENIIDQQPPVPELLGNAAQNRFNLLFQKFVQIFTTKEHPLVIFLDDLQWADSASFNLMQLLMSTSDAGYLLLIGAYRDNEVSATHPLMLSLADINKNKATVNTIKLETLSKSSLTQLVADTLICSREIAQPLTQLIYQKTQGNPFFITQVFKALYEGGLILFDRDHRSWQCDITQVTQYLVTDDVVAFMALQLQKLPLSTQSVLKLAACIGNQFDLATLAIVAERSEVETATDLWKALQEGLILPISDVYKFYQQETLVNSHFSSVISQQIRTHENRQVKVSYRFLHDRIQQAAYSLIPDEHKQTTHLNIGNLILNTIANHELEEKIFVITNQLNLGRTKIKSPQQQEKLISLNLLAAKKARLSSAYQASAEYCKIGWELISADAWQQNFRLMLDLHIEATNATSLIGEFELVDQLVATILEYTTDVLDQVKAIAIQIQSLIARNNLAEAIQIARQILQSLGVELPADPNSEIMQSAIADIQQKLAIIDHVASLEPMSDRQKLAAMNILSSMASAAYIGSPALYPLIVLKQIELSLAFGYAVETAYAFSTYGLILCGFCGEIVAGNQAADVALELMAQAKSNEYKAKIHNLVYSFVRVWRDHLQTGLNPLIEGYQAGLESGDLEFAAYCAFNHCQLAYFSGQNLQEVQKKMQDYSDAIANIKQTTALNFHQIVQQAVLNWTGNNYDPQHLIGTAYNEIERLPQHQAAGDTYSIGSAYTHKLILAYNFAEAETALEIAQLAQSAIAGIAGTPLLGEYYFYHALTLIANSQAIAEDLAKLQQFSQQAQETFVHKCDLLQAESYRVFGERKEAIDLYDRAISGAKQNQYLQEEALANELAAKFYLEWGKEKVAAGYMQEAYYCYARWGAKAKINDLEKHYPQLLQPILKQRQLNLDPLETITTLPLSSLTQSTQTATITSSSLSDLLDFTSVIQAAQVISQNIELEELITSLTKIILENSGAQICVLMLPEENTWQVRAITLISYDQTTQSHIKNILVSESIDNCKYIPIKIVNYVKNFQKPVVIDNCQTDIPGTIGEYMLQNQPQSVLCTPIINQGHLIGILYLENHATAGVFTKERLQLINLLSSQAAISLENARLYQKSQQALADLQQAQLQIVQSEKMSALGNLVAGVAHEMNNPLGFIYATLQQSQASLADIFDHLKIYQVTSSSQSDEIINHSQKIDLDYTLKDLPKMMDGMVKACERLKNISTSLRIFSRADKDYKVPFNIHEGIDSTILILKHRLKANPQRPAIEVITEYGNIPQIECFPGQLNQVFMNILANAIDALEESNNGRSFEDINAHPNHIIINTYIQNNHVKITITDNAMGMSEEVKNKIFDHLFTTKAVGKGTGLGLAIAKQIVVDKHRGTITVESNLGTGTSFIICLPVNEDHK